MSAGGTDRCIAIQNCHLRGEAIREHDVVRIHPDDVLTQGSVHSPLCSATRAHVRLQRDDAQPWILYATQQSQASVGAGIIHRDDLEILESLGEHTVQALLQVRRLVVDRYHHRDFHAGHSPSLRPTR